MRDRRLRLLSLGKSIGLKRRPHFSCRLPRALTPPQALLARLRSPEAEVRAQAARELHAVQALGLAGARPTLEERGRVASDPRMNRPRFATQRSSRHLLEFSING